MTTKDDRVNTASTVCACNEVNSYCVLHPPKGNGVRVVASMCNCFGESVAFNSESNDPHAHVKLGRGDCDNDPLILATDEADQLDSLNERVGEKLKRRERMTDIILFFRQELRAHATYLRGLK